MSVVLVKELIASGPAKISQSGERSYTRKFLVKTNNKRDDSTIIRFSNGIPRLYQPYAFGPVVDLGALCVDIDIQPGDSAYVWDVTCEYSTVYPNPEQAVSDATEAGSGSSSEFLDSPLDKPAKIRWSTRKFKKPFRHFVQLSTTGGELRDPLNSARDPYSGVETDAANLVMNITRNEANFDPLTIRTFLFAVNEDYFLGSAPRTAMIVDLTADDSFENGVRFWTVNYQIEFDEDTHDVVLLDRGFRTRNSSTGEYSIIRDDDGTPVSEPSLLDGSGQVLASGGTPVYNTFQRPRILSFATLNLP